MGGCKHYERKCEVLAPCCDKFYSCRLCHDEDEDKACKTEHMDRHEVQKVRCTDCGEVQSAGEKCSGCGVTFAEYFCSCCRMYSTPTAAGIYHCEGCGICRVGKRENFFHCETCKACFTHESKTRGDHVCIDSSLSQDCPICLEYMFTSR